MPSTFEGAAIEGGALRDSVSNHAPEIAPESAAARRQEHREADTGLVVEELLVEDISIDGMCGVY